MSQRYVKPRRGKLARIDAKGAIIYTEDGAMATADHVVDDPREPRIMATGVLDANGEMLLRVAIPIKVQMGFHTPGRDRMEQDEVYSIVPESMLSVVMDMPGEGIAFVDESELEYGDEPAKDEG